MTTTTTNRYCCKTCGAESPAGIGYYVAPDSELPAPAADCIGPHLTTTTEVHPQPRLHLQGVGKVLAKPAGDLHRGDTLMWNYGTTSTVVSVRPVGAKSVEVVEEYGTGHRYTRTFRRDRLVYDDQGR